MNLSSSNLEDNNPYDGDFSLTKEVRVEPEVSFLLNGGWLPGHIIAVAKFSRHGLDCACFLKSEESGHIYKSECVSDKAPQAIVGDWRMQEFDE